MDDFPGRKTASPLRVLIVDDEPDTVLSTSILLKIYGYEVLTAGNGRAALDLVTEEQPHVVVLDLAMPGMSGIAVARSIRERAIYRRPFLIAHTGMRDPQTVREVREVGIDLLMYKPAPFDALRDVLDRFAPFIEENAIDSRETWLHADGPAIGTTTPNEVGLAVEISPSGMRTAVKCCLCDRAWEVQCVQVELQDNHRKLGVLCPACLRIRPGYLADQIKDEADALASRFNKLQGCMAETNASQLISASDPAALKAAVTQLRAHSERLRDQCREIRQHSARLRAASEKSRREIVRMHERLRRLVLESRRLSSRHSGLAQSTITGELVEAATQYEEMLILADQFKKLDHWSVSLTGLIQRERTCMSQRFPNLDAADLRRLVDERYDQFIRSSA